jgi:hypothetical protein
MDGRPPDVIRYPVEDSVIQQRMLYENSICHGAAIYRRDLWEELRGYSVGEYEPAEDWELWTKMAERSCLANSPTALMKIRVHSASTSSKKRLQHLVNIRRLLQQAMQRRLAGVGLPILPWAAARHYLFTGLIYLLEGDQDGLQSSLHQACEARKDFLADRKHISGTVVDLALEAGRLNGSPELELPFVEAFFSALPGSGRRLKRETLSLYHVASAFRYRENEDWRSARTEVRKGVALNPAWLRNRGVMSIWLKSFHRG